MNINTHRPSLARTGLAEKREAAPKLALLDDFDGDPDGFPHGQAVESVLMDYSGLTDADVQRYQNTPKQADLVKLMKQDGMPFRTAFRTMVARNVAHFYLGTATNLHTILAEQPSIEMVSQSQGETPGRHLETLFDGLQNNQAFREGASLSFGLDKDAPLAEVCQALLDEADRVVADNEICQKARKEFEKAAKSLHDNGITYLVAAGNHGPIGETMQALGVEASPTAFRNILVNDYVTVVGAHTAEGEPSRINSPLASIEAYRRGEDLAWTAKEPGFDQSGVDSGTSFATPIAAGDAAEFLQDNPDFGPFQAESFLMGLDSYRVQFSETTQLANGQELRGDGLLDAFISEKIGPGFITDISSPDATQIAQANRDRTFFGLPGQKDHEFQLVKMRPDPSGQRQLTVETYFDEGHHVLQADAKDGAWDPATVVEELHFDAARQREIEKRSETGPT